MRVSSISRTPYRPQVKRMTKRERQETLTGSELIDNSSMVV